MTLLQHRNFSARLRSGLFAFIFAPIALVFLGSSMVDVQALAAGQTVTETFTYTVSDGQAHADAGPPDSGRAAKHQQRGAGRDNADADEQGRCCVRERGRPTFDEQRKRI